MRSGAGRERPDLSRPIQPRSGRSEMSVSPSCDPPGVEGVAATRFAAMARFLAAESREAGLVVPAFRSPPRVAGVARTIRRVGEGAIVAIQIRGREADDVVTDMIEGIVITNRLDPSAAGGVRSRLRAAVAPVEIDLTAVDDDVPASGRILPTHARMAERQTQAA